MKKEHTNYRRRRLLGSQPVSLGVETTGMSDKTEMLDTTEMMMDPMVEENSQPMSSQINAQMIYPKQQNMDVNWKHVSAPDLRKNYSTETDQEKVAERRSTGLYPSPPQHIGYNMSMQKQGQHAPSSIEEHLRIAGKQLGVEFTQENISSIIRGVRSDSDVMTKRFFYSRDFTFDELEKEQNKKKVYFFEPNKCDLLQFKMIKKLRLFKKWTDDEDREYDYNEDPLLYKRLVNCCEDLRVSYEPGCNIFHMYNDSPLRFSMEIPGFVSYATFNPQTLNYPIGPILSPGCRKGNLDNCIKLTPKVMRGLDDDDLYLMSMNDSNSWRKAFKTKVFPGNGYNVAQTKMYELDTRDDLGVVLASTINSKFPEIGEQINKKHNDGEPVIFSRLELDQLKKKIGKHVTSKCGGYGLSDFKINLKQLTTKDFCKTSTRKHNVTIGVEYVFRSV